MSWTSDLTVALAEYLDAAGVGTWSPTGIFPTGATGIVLKVMPATPDDVIVLTPYTVTGNHMQDVTQGMQIRCRAGGRPDAVDDLADEVYGVLHGAEDFDLGPAHVGLCWRQSHAQMGRDGDGRQETTSNFYLLTSHPSEHVR